LNKIVSLIALFVLIYFEFSIFVVNKPTVGQIGFVFSQFSHNYFGYIAYIYLFIFAYILYKINFKKTTALDLTLRVCTLLTLLFSLVIFQTLVLKDKTAGILGNEIVSFLSPFIGNAGLWIFIIIGLLIFLMVFLENKKEEFSNNLKNFLIVYKPKEKVAEKKDYKYSKNKNSDKKEDKITIKEVGDTAEIVIEPFEQNQKSLVSEEIEEADIVEVNEELPHALMVDELEENKKLLDEIELGKNEKPKDFQLPSTAFFQEAPKEKKNKVNEVFIDKKIADLLEKLLMFKIEGDVVRTYTGPIVTTFEFKPAPNVKVSKILNLQDDLAMALKAQTIRIQAPIPGKDVVGIEVPNEDSQVIYIRELLESEIFQNAKSPLTMILGKDIVGKPFITDLKKLPHLLIAGTTGSGKSVGLNCMILSLLYKNSPDTLRLIMIDPKMLEFSIYNDIPHLLTPVITRPTEAINALSNMVSEMERRYTLMSQTKTKNIENYNEKAIVEKYDPFPYIVVIIDELADLMMTSGKEVELSIARLAQMARASGIHLIVATQRPSVDVVTGLIKANLPSRISYKVGQRVDSKIILDSMGAESLLGRGDMLFTPPGMSGLVRLHAPWSTEVEIEKVADFLKEQREVQYDMQFVKQKDQSLLKGEFSENDLGDLDELYEEAKQIVIMDQKSSISYLQRKLRIGYNRAATIVEQLEKTGVLSEANIKGNRDILI
jgi:S-DNA-T family DNA segregation ATPase FtsK/SpoIIIE